MDVKNPLKIYEYSLQGHKDDKHTSGQYVFPEVVQLNGKEKCFELIGTNYKQDS